MKKKKSGEEAVIAEKGWALFISNEDTNDIKVIKSLEDSGVLIDGVTKTAKHEIRKQKRWISSCIVRTFGYFISATNDFFSSKSY